MATKLDKEEQSVINFEIKHMLEWFTSWDSSQRRLFLESVLPKVVPHKLFAQTSRMNLNEEESSQRHPSEPSNCTTFQQQLLFCHKCLEKWAADSANHFMTLLEDIDRSALYSFYDMIASTAGEV